MQAVVKVRSAVALGALLAVVAAVFSASLGGAASSDNRPHIAQLVRYAILLENDAQFHHVTAKTEARRELTASEAVLKGALGLGPPAAAAALLRQAVTKDQDALALLATVNEGKVRLDIVTALIRKENALKEMGEPVAGAVLPPAMLKPVKPPAVKPPPKLTAQQIAVLVSEAAEDERAFDHEFDRPPGTGNVARPLEDAMSNLEKAAQAASLDPRLEQATDYIRHALGHDAVILNWFRGYAWGEAFSPDPDFALESAFGDKFDALKELDVLQAGEENDEEASSKPPGGRSAQAAGTGTVWFTEFAGNKIGRVTVKTKKVTEFPIPTPDSRPEGIALGPDGNYWFTETKGDKIGRITPAGSITEFPVPTPNAFPEGVTSGPDGNVWFTELGGSKIGRITPAGSITEFALRPGSFPAGITAGPDRNLWFVETVGRIGRIATTGALLPEFPIPTPNSFPTSIARGPDGNLWLTEYQGNRIARINVAATTLSEWTLKSPARKPLTITAGSDGAMWFSERGLNRLGRITTKGKITEVTLPKRAFDPVGVTAGPDGNIWYTGFKSSVIGWLAPNTR